MPWPMVHFAVSYQLYSGKPTPHLLLGSIAPDSLHARGQTTREEKGRTHLVQNDQLASPALIMQTLQSYLDERPQVEWKDYIVGYFTHIYTDMKWTHNLYAEYKEQYHGEDIRHSYHQEAAQLEFELQRIVQEQGDDPVSMLLQAEGYAVEPLVTASEVTKYRDMKIEWLNDAANEPHIVLIYFTLERVEEFVRVTSEELQKLFKQHDIEQLLQPIKID